MNSELPDFKKSPSKSILKRKGLNANNSLSIKS